MIRILHTSDWHIGRSLGAFKRYEEHEKFLDWLSELIMEKQVDVLLVAGDVFDSSTPSNRAQELYFRFLKQAADQGCRHIVMVAGNHDSPSMLDAPRVLLKTMNIHIIGTAPADPDDSVILLQNDQGDPELIVCAIPFLRDRDVRSSEAGESPEEREKKLTEGIRKHYQEVCRQAVILRDSLPGPVPIAATGHLFAAGARVGEDDGLRDLYVGTLGRIASDIFPESCDYVALGHLHSPQMVSGKAHIRYSGAPLHFSFGERNGRRCVIIADFNGTWPLIEEIPVPEFQRLERISGSWDDIAGRLEQLKAEYSDAWLEIVCDDSRPLELGVLLNEAVAGSRVKVVKSFKKSINEGGGLKGRDGETLDELEPVEVFERLISAREVDESLRDELVFTFKEALSMVLGSDANAE